MSIETVGINLPGSLPAVVEVRQGPQGPPGNPSAFYGQVYRITDATVSGLTEGVFKVVDTAGTVDSDNTTSGIVTADSGKLGLKYTSATTRKFSVIASADLLEGNNEQLGLALAKNGTVIAATESRAYTTGSTHECHVGTAWIVELAQNDNLTLTVANNSGTGDITVKRAQLTLYSIS